MNQDLLRKLSITGGIYDCLCDPYDKLRNGDPYSSVIVDLDRLADKIIEECIQHAVEFNNNLQSLNDKEIRTHSSRIGEYMRDRIK